ncbi:MAG: hypothetical protein EOP37_26315 [Rubrivivax sp.]|nr:MAG: hypothetical protein EOP37_26315 [Rubrivivax sp.]
MTPHPDDCRNARPRRGVSPRPHLSKGRQNPPSKVPGHPLPTTPTRSQPSAPGGPRRDWPRVICALPANAATWAARRRTSPRRLAGSLSWHVPPFLVRSGWTLPG